MIPVYKKNRTPERMVEYLIEVIEGIETTNNPNDKGGLTKFGLSKKYNPGINFDTLTYQGAIKIYLNKYWVKCKSNLLPYPISCIHFFNNVILGGKESTIILQKCIKSTLNINIAIDGIIGYKETIPNIKTIISSSHHKNIFMMYYIAFSCKTLALKTQDEEKDTDKIFLEGWMNRIIKYVNYLKED